MARGRPRKEGQRYESGDLIREDPRIVAELSRIRHKLSRDAREQSLDNFLGVAWWYGQITPVEFEAGKQFAELRGRYWKISGFPSENPRGLTTFEYVSRSSGEPMEENPERDARITSQYYAAQKVLDDQGQAVGPIVVEVCCNGEPIGNAFRLERLRAGLQQLAEHFCIAGSVTKIAGRKGKIRASREL